MNGWIIAGLILLLLGLLRVGVRVEYSGTGLEVNLRLGPVSIRVFPGKKNKKAKEQKEKRRKAKQKQQDKKRLTGGQLELFCQFVPLVLRVVKKLFGALRTDKLELILITAAPDPADAALGYGRANALLGALWQPLVQTLHVADGHAGVQADFDAHKPAVYLMAALSLRVWQVVVLAAAFSVQAVIILLRTTKSTSN